MVFNVFKNTVLLFLLVLISCGNFSKHGAANHLDLKNVPLTQVQDGKTIAVGANQTEIYLPLLQGKKVGIVANQTSVIFKDNTQKTYTHLVDSLLALRMNVIKVFAPEHGFRGTADAGAHIEDDTDTKTGLPVLSLYGANKKPSGEQLQDLDLVIFDIQDVGARFYTYISTLHYVMEACAENKIPLLILDRPNPNSFYVDGPVLEPDFKSFVGMHPVPVVHGMTLGEYAQMINGEHWLDNGIQCELTVIPVKNYSHNMLYSLPIKPSPNLPNDKAINLYPSLCFFEGTNVSAGRGTDKQFQIFGSPFLNKNIYSFEFTPISNEGATYPKYQNTLCHGLDLSKTDPLDALHLNWLIESYKNTETPSEFFNDFFTKLAGTKVLQQQIEAGLSESEIKASWQSGLDTFKKIRAKYLLYN